MHVSLAMIQSPFVLRRFVATPPRYSLEQAESFAWLAAAHARSEATAHGLSAAAEAELAERLERLLARCGCRPDQIRQRAIAIPDIGSFAFDDNRLYDLSRRPHGADTGERTRRFGEIVDDYFVETYADEATAPDDLIHVTCTGYVSPNGAQKLVSHRGWGTTRVTAAYHMGCYAALPALRIASGCLATGSRRADIVHTELCSLHFEPSNHSLEQLVVQSLFADGLIRYRLEPGGSGLRVLALHERVLPESSDSMSWRLSAAGMQMTLARDVPEKIAGLLRSFVIELLAKANRDLGILSSAVLAVHPGGPKILDRVRDVLEVSEAQIAASRAVLHDRGNMSSATLPHIWQRLLDDPSIPAGTPIPSLAFGPGLTVCGALLEKT